MTGDSWRLAGLLGAAALLGGGAAGLACQPPAGDDDSAAGDDDTADDLDYHDQEPGLYQEGTFGLLMVTAERSSDGGGPVLMYEAAAQFFQVQQGESLALQGIEYDPDEGLDDCSLRWYTGQGLGDPGEVDWWAAAGVTVSSGPQSAALQETTGGEVIDYAVDLGAQGYDPRWGEGYAFAVAGAEAPGLDLDPALVLPAQLELTSPDLGSGAPLPRQDLPLQWTGSGDEPLEIVISGYETGDTVPPWYEIHCHVLDDGAFLVAGDLLQVLPSGGTAVVRVVRSALGVVQNGEGLDVVTVGAAVDRGRMELE